MDINLVTSKGIDRATGAILTDPNGFYDLRNFRPDEGRVLARGGLIEPIDNSLLKDGSDAASDVAQIIPFRSIGGAVVVGYNRSDDKVTVWTVDGFGGNADLVGVWATLNSSAELPHFIGAEAGDKLFLAHDEEDYQYRLKTIYFDPSQTPGSQLVDLEADLDGDSSAADIKFRGVCAWTDYLIGWGYGTEASGQGDNPTILRISLPNAPQTFNKSHYFNVGAKGVPITAVGIAGGQPQIMKAHQRYMLIGSNRTNFDVIPADEFGCLNGRLLGTFGDVLAYWSEQGPRITHGGHDSVDLAIALDLLLPEPSDLPALGAVRDAWGATNILDRTVIFAWPDLVTPGTRTRAYVLGFRRPTDYRWAYDDIGQLVYSGAALAEARPAPGPPTGYVDTVAASDTGVGRQVTITWANHSLTGGETVEIFSRAGSGGTWMIATSVQAGASVTSVILSNQPALTQMFYAIRMVRGGVATDGYESSNPDNWDASTQAGSKDDVVTSCATPTAFAGLWSRTGATTHKFAFSWTLAQLGVGFSIEESADGVSLWAEVKSVAAAGDPRGADYSPLNSLLYSTRYYRIRAVGPDGFSAYSSTVQRWVGPSGTPLVDVYQQLNSATLQIFISELTRGKIQINTSATGTGGWSVDAPFALGGPPSSPQAFPSPIALGSITYWRIRWAITNYGIEDYTDYTTGNLRLTSASDPGTPAAATYTHTSTPSDLGKTTAAFSAPSPFHRLFRFQQRGTLKIWRLQQTGAVGNTSLALSLIRTPEDFSDLLGGQTATHENDLRYEDIWAAGSPFAFARIYEYLLDTSNNQRRISQTPRVTDVEMVSAGGPTAPVVSQPGGTGTLRVEWTTSSTFVYVFWNTVASPTALWKQLVAASGSSLTQVNGPGGGFEALPPAGTLIKVRVFKWAPSTIPTHLLETTYTLI